MVSRLEVPLDDERRQRLDDLAEDQAAPVDEVVCRMIDEKYEAMMRERRHAAYERIVSLRIDVPLDSDDLHRILEEAHEPGGLA